ncbi:hypothetical protein GCM10025865_22770 [Paraoerskovia sediminicola]|uniref:Lipoprotein n=1 Tax=Paraoerskovia sediminicola TaxID=1138587 RepID=A0ABM8G4H4_9CELL|nr:hypothetical protein [Paraoerskovia sediminicola]BDZ42978.1 hypothetical protein GCM10025865_22770 [Paraoerskovia sediminicola]
MQRKTLPAVLAAGLLVTGLAACSSDDGSTDSSTDASTAAASASAPAVVKDTEYRIVDDLKDAAVAAGLACDDWTTIDPVAPAWQVGTCGDSTLTLYRAQEDKTQGADAARDDADAVVLVGPNWTVVTSQDVVDTIQPALGGSTDVEEPAEG